MHPAYQRTLDEAEILKLLARELRHLKLGQYHIEHGFVHSTYVIFCQYAPVLDSSTLANLDNAAMWSRDATNPDIWKYAGFHYPVEVHFIPGYRTSTPALSALHSRPCPQTYPAKMSRRARQLLLALASFSILTDIHILLYEQVKVPDPLPSVLVAWRGDTMQLSQKAIDALREHGWTRMPSDDDDDDECFGLEDVWSYQSPKKHFRFLVKFISVDS